MENRNNFFAKNARKMLISAVMLAGVLFLTGCASNNAGASQGSGSNSNAQNNSTSAMTADKFLSIVTGSESSGGGGYTITSGPDNNGKTVNGVFEFKDDQGKTVYAANVKGSNVTVVAYATDDPSEPWQTGTVINSMGSSSEKIVPNSRANG